MRLQDLHRAVAFFPHTAHTRVATAAGAVGARAVVDLTSAAGGVAAIPIWTRNKPNKREEKQSLFALARVRRRVRPLQAMFLRVERDTLHEVATGIGGLPDSKPVFHQSSIESLWHVA
jgi:hypothetical protein